MNVQKTAPLNFCTPPVLQGQNLVKKLYFGISQMNPLGSLLFCLTFSGNNL